MKIYCVWTALKNKLDSGIELYYYNQSEHYEIFIVDGNNIWFTEIWKSYDNIAGIDVDQNALDLTDFEDNYKDNAEIL